MSFGRRVNPAGKPTMLAAMSIEMVQVLMVVMSVWGVAMVAKAIHALRTDRPYTFAMWDGGLLRAGRSLNRRGAQLRVFVGGAMTLSCLGWVTGVMPTQVAFSASIMIALASIISSFAHEAQTGG